MQEILQWRDGQISILLLNIVQVEEDFLLSVYHLLHCVAGIYLVKGTVFIYACMFYTMLQGYIEKQGMILKTKYF